MSTHNIGFYGELRKVILELSLNSLICCTVPQNILSRVPDIIKISDDKLKGKQLIMYNLSHVTRKSCLWDVPPRYDSNWPALLQ